MQYPALVATHAGLWRADSEGNAGAVSRAEAVRRLTDTPHLLLNAPQVAARLGLAEVSGLDLLELFAFVHPARFLVPSAGGLAAFLGLEAPANQSAEPAFLQQAAAALIDTASRPEWPALAGSRESLDRLNRKGWLWSRLLDEEMASENSGPRRQAPSLFEALPEWADVPPRAAPRITVLQPAQVTATLTQLAGNRREPRDGQKAFAQEIAHAFQPRDSRDGPNLVVAEAGTGIGKTLGYLAPAALYAQETGGSVWLSTYTRALQRQLKAETARSLPHLVQAGKIVVRKGRENYLCLLNLEDALQGAFAGRPAIFADLAARWARFSEDGDMVGGDLPGWLAGLFRRSGALPALTDRRGECIHAACPHYRRCFIEKSQRQGQQASLVIANHALVMANAVRARAEGQGLSRLVFDEGHHLHAAADGAFSIALTGGEAIELRRWLLGPDRPGRRSGRRRGLAARLLDVTSYDGEGGTALEELLDAARLLPSADWLSRIAAGEPEGPIEALAAADGFAGMGLDRRTALWDARGVENDTPPLLRLAGQAAAAGEPPLLSEPSSALPAEDDGQAMMLDYVATGLSLRQHPLARVRGQLAALDGAFQHPADARGGLFGRGVVAFDQRHVQPRRQRGGGDALPHRAQAEKCHSLVD